MSYEWAFVVAEYLYATAVCLKDLIRHWLRMLLLSLLPEVAAGGGHNVPGPIHPDL